MSTESKCEFIGILSTVLFLVWNVSYISFNLPQTNYWWKLPAIFTFNIICMPVFGVFAYWLSKKVFNIFEGN